MERRPGYNYNDPNNAHRPPNPDPNVPIVFPEIVDDPPSRMGDLPPYDAPVGRYERDVSLNVCDPVADMRPNLHLDDSRVNLPTLQDVKDMRDFSQEHAE